VEPQIQQWLNLTLYSLIGVPLVGTLPSEIGLLSRLKILYLGPAATSLETERLQGTIPSEFWQLTHLEQFTLHHNRFTGTIPSELGRMSNLTAVGLQGNLLTGSIPSEMGALTR
jgi:Leucine-rich repeat (LRR) protein